MRIAALAAGNVKSKTSWFSVLLIVFGTLNDSTNLLTAILPKNDHVGAIIAGIGLITLILRNMTTESIAEKAENPPPPEVKP